MNGDIQGSRSRQAEQARARRLDGVAHTGGFVGRQIIHDDQMLPPLQHAVRRC